MPSIASRNTENSERPSERKRVARLWWIVVALLLAACGQDKGAAWAACNLEHTYLVEVKLCMRAKGYERVTVAGDLDPHFCDTSAGDLLEECYRPASGPARWIEDATGSIK